MGGHRANGPAPTQGDTTSLCARYLTTPLESALLTLDEARDILGDPMRDRRYLETRLGPDIADHLTYCRLGNLRPTTMDAKERILARFAISLPAGVGVADVTVEHIERYLVELPEGSWHTHRSHLNQFFTWAIDRDRRATKNPVRQLARLVRRGRKRTIDVFNEREREVIIAASEQMDDPARDRVRAHILLDAGIRRAEAMGLRNYAVDPVRREIKVVGKGDKERVIPVMGAFWLAWENHLLTPYPRMGRLPEPDDFVWFPMRIAGEYGNRVRQVTKAYPEKPMVDRGFHEWWVRLLGHTNVVYRKPHTTRHTYATDALDASDGDVYGVKELLGHEKLATTELYLHGAKKRKQSVAESLAKARKR